MPGLRLTVVSAGPISCARANLVAFAPGHQALILDLAQRGRICLGGDVGHLREGYDQMIPMPGTGAPARCQ
jgi:hypothetical protein